MSLLPALDESEKNSGHGWSTTNRFSAADMDHSQSKLFHQLINQNNAGEVPDALNEEEICYQEDSSDQSSYHPSQSPVSQNTSHLKQQLLQQQQQQQQQQYVRQPEQQQQVRQQLQQQHVKQPVRNFIQQPATSKPTKVLYSVVQTAGAAQRIPVSNQQHVKNMGNQQNYGQVVNQQTVGQIAPQVQIQNTNLARQKFAVQGHNLQQQQQQMALKGSQQVRVDVVAQSDEEELNRAIQRQQQEIEDNNRKLAELGCLQMSVQVDGGQKSVGKCNYIGSVKMQNPQITESSDSANTMRQLLLINSSQANSRKMDVKVVNNNGATFSNSARTPPQLHSVMSPSGSSGLTSQTTQILTPGPRTNSQINMKGQSLLVDQKTPVSQNQTIVQVHSVSSKHNQQTGSGDRLAGEVSKEKVVLEGGGQFQEGEAYLVHSKDGRTRTMLLKNGKFIPYDPDKNIIQHSKIDSSQHGRGRGNRARLPRGRGRGRGQFQGNATGINMVPNVRSPNPVIRQPGMAAPRSPAVVRSPTRPSRQDFHVQRAMGSARPRMPAPVVIHTTAHQVSSSQTQAQTLQRPQVHLQNLMPAAQGSPKAGITTVSQQLARRSFQAEGQTAEGTTNDIKDVDASASTERIEQGTTTERGDAQDLPNIPSDPHAQAVCQFCGYVSTDKVKCESCYRRFTSATRFIKPNSAKEDSDAKRRKLEVTKDGNGAVIDKKTFYKNKLDEQNQVYSQVFNASNSASTVLRTSRILSRGGVARGRRGRGRGRVVVPETVTISSDEEEGSTASDKAASLLLHPGTPLSSQGNHASQGSVGSRSPSSADCPESPLIPTIPISTKRLPIGRLEKMEDEKGASRTAREGSVSPAQVLLNARVVRVGTFRGALIEPIVVNKNGISFFIEGVSGSHRFNIFPHEIQQCLVKFDDQSLMFFLTSPGCGGRTRKDLGIPHHMNPKLPPPEPYFDPSGIDMTHQMITVMMGLVEREIQAEFQKHMETFKSFGKQGDEAFYMELSVDEAEEIMKQSTRKASPQQMAVAPPAVLGEHGYSQAGEEDRHSRSPSPPRIGFVGPIIKLLTYPPPPSKGALSITNEDLYCLQEGEFLNDVIIDFYLKYLLLEKLSDEDRTRTHVFSSFFYKRLTQRIRGAAIDDDPNVSLAVKRHARVKTWTRHVDLFQKDFIIIPINEHAHWFLAIICFPGLMEPVENKYIPKPVTAALPEPTNVPTPPQPAELTQEEMETDEAEVPSEPAKYGSQTDTSETPSENKTEEKNEESEEMETQNSEEAQEEKQDQELEADSEETEKEKEVNGSEETEDPEKQTNSADKVEEKPDESADDSAKDVNDEKAANTTTNNSSTSTTTGTSTSTNTQPQKVVIMKVGARGKKISKEEEDKAENVATGIKQPCVIVFDSLSGPPRSRIVQVLKEYLQVEWSVKKKGEKELNKTNIKGCVPKVPQQNNYSDCGVYLLQYVESFFEDPVQDFSIPIKGLHDWFSIPKIEGKREDLRSLIIELKEKYESQSETNTSTS